MAVVLLFKIVHGFICPLRGKWYTELYMSTWLMWLCPPNNNVSLYDGVNSFCWSVPITLWWIFHLLHLLVELFLCISFFPVACGGFSLFSASIFSAGYIIFSSVSFFSISILLICSLFCILENLSIICSTYCLFAICCLLSPFWGNFLRYGVAFHALLGSSNNTSSQHHFILVVSPIVVFWSVPIYCSMHPWNPILMLYCYSWPCR